MKLLSPFIACFLLVLCCFNSFANNDSPHKKPTSIDRFDDIEVLSYKVNSFEHLSLKEKKIAYYLSQAGYAGRDIMYDQNFKHNLTIRRTIDEIIHLYPGDRTHPEFEAFHRYAKKVWFSNGIHHHYSSDKFKPEFSAKFFRHLVMTTPSKNFPTLFLEKKANLCDRLIPILFDSTIAPKKVHLGPNQDVVESSCVNFYDEQLTQTEVEQFYNNLQNDNVPKPISYGLNSKLVKGSVVDQFFDNFLYPKNFLTNLGTQSIMRSTFFLPEDKIYEKVYRSGGMYSAAIKEIIKWLSKAADLCDSSQQKSLHKLIEFYASGDLKAFDEYNILWVKDKNTTIDLINGFIEVYNDPLGYKGSFESVVFTPNKEMTEKFGIIGDHAQWFENNSPIDPLHKRNKAVGVSYRIVDVIAESGDASPSTPIGINLPNSNWIRSEHGSKSISLGNIEHAYKEAKSKGALEEFYLPHQQNWIRDHKDIVDILSTGLHEVIGHASGQLEKGVKDPSTTLKSYASCLEEARADLVALYYIGDPYLVKLGLTPSIDVIKAEYITYFVNGLYGQLYRIKEGKIIEESHMRNRQLITRWVYEQLKDKNVIEIKKIENKTYTEIHDFQIVRKTIGELLKEVQRIKSQGDFQAGKNLVENYGIRFDTALHKEVLSRWKDLNIAPYAGFVNPRLTPKINKKGEITDILISYPKNFTAQMLHYGKTYSFLPHYN